MDKNFLLRPQSIALQVYEQILKRIVDGTYPPGSKLPTENQLSSELDVSRSTIRNAYSRLEIRGYITRRRGIGTFVAESSSLAGPLYEDLDIGERISNQGKTPEHFLIKTDVIKAGNVLANQLNVDPESEVYYYQRAFTSNGVLVVQYTGQIPFWVFKDKVALDELKQPDALRPFHKFFAERFNCPVTYVSSTAHPEILSNLNLPEMFTVNLDPCTPVLMLESIGFTYDDIPVFASFEHLLFEASNVSFIRPLSTDK